MYRIHWKWSIWSLLLCWPCLKVKEENGKHLFCHGPIWSEITKTIFDWWILPCIIHDPLPHFHWIVLKLRGNFFRMICGVLHEKRLKGVILEGWNWSIYMETKNEFIWCIVSYTYVPTSHRPHVLLQRSSAIVICLQRLNSADSVIELHSLAWLSKQSGSVIEKEHLRDVNKTKQNKKYITITFTVLA